MVGQYRDVLRQCSQCNKFFMGSRYNYKPSGAPIYCSISCGLRSHTDPTNSCIRVCQECGIEFETWNSQPRKYCSRDCSHVHGKNKSAWYTVLGHRCQGKYESLFVVWAVSSGLHFVPHGKGVAMPYVDAKGTDRKYFPDFWVQEWDCYIDIKSDWTKKLAGDKIERVLAANPNVKIRVLADADLIGLGVQVTTKDQYRFKVLMLENGGVLSSIDEWTSMQQREVIDSKYRTMLEFTPKTPTESKPKKPSPQLSLLDLLSETKKSA